MRRLVEAKLLFQFRDEFRVDPPREFVAALAARFHAAGSAASAADHRGCRDVLALNSRDGLVDGASRRRLDDDEVHQHDADQSRQHQHEPAREVGRADPDRDFPDFLHGLKPILSGLVALLVTLQSGEPGIHPGALLLVQPPQVRESRPVHVLGTERRVAEPVPVYEVSSRLDALRV